MLVCEDKVLGLQPAQGFSDRHSTDAEPGSQFRLLQFGAVPQFSQNGSSNGSAPKTVDSLLVQL
jgi:hypothetical protein